MCRRYREGWAITKFNNTFGLFKPKNRVLTPSLTDNVRIVAGRDEMRGWASCPPDPCGRAMIVRQVLVHEHLLQPLQTGSQVSSSLVTGLGRRMEDSRGVRLRCSRFDALSPISTSESASEPVPFFVEYLQSR